MNFVSIYFYFGQDQYLRDETAVLQAVDNLTDWILAQGHRNDLIEVNNECNVRYTHSILQPERVHELIQRIQSRRQNGQTLLTGTSYGGGFIPLSNVVSVSDFILIHGNGVNDPDDIRRMVRTVREMPEYRNQPILFNEDDPFDFDQLDYNFLAALDEYASWGCFDYRTKGEGFECGYQSVPLDWGIRSERKEGFFN